MRLNISPDRARSFGPLAYRKAKQGRNMLVSHHGQMFWLCHSANGFFLTPFDAARSQSEQVA